MGILHDDEEDLRAELATVKAERDRYLTRACVAEAKVAKVLDLVTPWAPAQQEPVLMLALATGNLGRVHLAQEIITAIGGPNEPTK